MLMKGDYNKLIEQINPVFDEAFKRIEELSKRVEALEKADKPKRGRPRKEDKAA